MKTVGRYSGVDSGVDENDDDAEDVDFDADDGKDVQVVPLTRNVQTLSLNLTQVIHCFPRAHIYISLLRYLVPHHYLPIQLTLHLLHVHLRLRPKVFLCGKREEKVCAEMKVHIFRMTTTDEQNVPLTNMCRKQQHLSSIRQSSQDMNSIILQKDFFDSHLLRLHESSYTILNFFWLILLLAYTSFMHHIF